MGNHGAADPPGFPGCGVGDAVNQVAVCQVLGWQGCKKAPMCELSHEGSEIPIAPETQSLRKPGCAIRQR